MAQKTFAERRFRPVVYKTQVVSFLRPGHIYKLPSLHLQHT